MAKHTLVSLKNQQGFTLIELMVVVVIMSVVVSVGVLSLGRINQDLVENQQAKIESYFKQVADQSAFNQKMYLIAPDDEGLTTYKYVNYEWQTADDIANLAWQKGFDVSWVLDKHFAEQQKITRPGWVFWPSGDVLSGSIILKNLDINTTSSSPNKKMQLSWNEALEFTRD